MDLDLSSCRLHNLHDRNVLIILDDGEVMSIEGYSKTLSRSHNIIIPYKHISRIVVDSSVYSRVTLAVGTATRGGEYAIVVNDGVRIARVDIYEDTAWVIQC